MIQFTRSHGRQNGSGSLKLPPQGWGRTCHPAIVASGRGRSESTPHQGPLTLAGPLRIAMRPRASAARVEHAGFTSS